MRIGEYTRGISSMLPSCKGDRGHASKTWVKLMYVVVIKIGSVFLYLNHCEQATVSCPYHELACRETPACALSLQQQRLDETTVDYAGAVNLLGLLYMRHSV